jgi:NADPH:quinone reductase-like Zn-dependent oxidoreductase
MSSSLEAVVAQLGPTDTVTIITWTRGGGQRSTPIWSAVADRAPYVRSAFGPDSLWYRRAIGRGRAAFQIDGAQVEVAVERVEDPAEIAAVDVAFSFKYADQAADLAPILTAEARACTLRLTEVDADADHGSEPESGLPASIRVVQYSRLGGPEVLEVVDAPTPAVPDDGALVAVRAAGVNPIDIKLRSGARPSASITEPRRVGSDASGVVIAVGGELPGVAAGDAVIIHDITGAYASAVVARAEQLDPKPDAWSFEQAAGVGVPVGTAYQALKSLGLREGMTLLIHGGSGSVGQAAIQFARDWGASVVATAGPKNHARIAELGATPVAYGDGLLERVRAAAPNGIDRVLDAAGTDEALEVSFACVSDRSNIGTIVVGARAAELGIQGWSGGNPEPLTDEQKAWRREAIGVAASLADGGGFDIEISERFPLERASDAQRSSESDGSRGKIVLLP